MIAKQLAAEGIDTVFCIVAGPMQQAWGALPREGVRLIGCRHEEQAGFMAQAYGYITKKPGVLMVGTGPGMTNTVTRMHVAQENCWPLVVLGGSVYGTRRGIGGFQEAPQVAVARPVCKWAIEVDSVARIPEYIHLALGRAMSGRPGSVYLDFPAQLLPGTVPEESITLRRPQAQPYRPHADPRAIEEVAKMLCSAQRPLVLIGKGAAWADAAEPLQRLVNYGLPFIPSPMGRGTVPDDDPNCMAAARSSAINDADAILMVGGRFNWIFLPKGYKLAEGGQILNGVQRRDVRIAQIDVLAEEMYSAAHVDIGVVADCSVAIDALCEAMSGRRLESSKTGWVEKLQAEAARNQSGVDELTRTDAMPINHYRVWGDVRDSIDRDATVIADGEITMGVGRIVMPSYYPRYRINAGTTACVGTGVPYAIAAKLARPDRQVVAVLGDYAFGAGFTEVETAARIGANVVFVVDNNSGILGHQVQDQWFRPEDGQIAALLPARYEMMAEMVGGYAEHVEHPEQLKPALRRALASNKRAIINVMTDPHAKIHATGPNIADLMGH